MQSPEDGLAPRMWLPVIALALKVAQDRTQNREDAV
jgi:hypothetical protein